MRRAATRRLGSIAVVVVGIMGYAAGVPASPHRPLPTNTVTTYWLLELSDASYAIPRDRTPESIGDGSMKLDVSNNASRDMLLWTACGSGHATRFEFTADRLVTDDFIMNTHPACAIEYFTAAERVGQVIWSNPSYRFDGRRLQLIGDVATVTFVIAND